jgi:class 3 adenylate cyclase/dienelactone hydrolase
MDIPETRYAKSGDVRIAYQVVGNGELDLVWVPGFVSNVELAWEDPYAMRFFSRLASFSRLIRFDKRGTGLSDRDAGVPSLEERMDDVRAVMDAVGSQRAALFGVSEGGSMSLLFAATYPERTRALVFYGAYAQYPRSRLESEDFIDVIDRAWGTGETLRFFARLAASDANRVRAFGRFERLGATPSAAIALQRMNEEIDVRHVLPTIRVPTLVLHRVGDERVKVEFGRYIAEHILGAKFVELPGIDHSLFLAELGDRIADEIEEFLTGSRGAVEGDRVLATVMFTDIVDSTRRAAELGDRDWRLLRDRHDDAIRQELARFRGHEVKTLGDGFLATFDGPARAVRCASAIIDRVRPLGMNVRSGLHTGEIEMQRDDVGGIAVHIAARVVGLAGAGEVLVSSTVRDLVAGSGLRFHDRGSHIAKGLPEPLRLFAAQV